MEIGQKIRVVDYHKGEFNGCEGEIKEVSTEEEAKYPIIAEILAPLPEEEYVMIDGKPHARVRIYVREDELELADPDEGIPDAFKES